MLAMVGLAAAALAAAEVRPHSAPSVFNAADYALTFHVPKGATYCPHPHNWAGTNHGTRIFLTPPSRCRDADDPSIVQGFAPNTTPRIEVYYGYGVLPEEALAPDPPCRPIASTAFLGRSTLVCRDASWDLPPGMVALTVRGKYEADIAAESAVTLITTPDRQERDLTTFRALVRSVRPCRQTMIEKDHAGRTVRTDHVGHGAPCPAAGRWF